QHHVPSAPPVPSSSDGDQEQWSEFSSLPVPRPPPRQAYSTMGFIGRIAKVVAFAAVVALVTILTRPLWQNEPVPRDADTQTSPNLKASDRLSANNAPANSPPVPAAGMAALPGGAPSASAQTQQASLSPNPQEPRNTFRGVT